MKSPSSQPPHLRTKRNKQVLVGLLLFVAGVSLFVFSDEMVKTVEEAPIPDAMDRWGPDGYSYLTDAFVFGGILVTLILSVVTEVLLWLTSPFGPSFSRWFFVFSVMIFIAGLLQVWSHWDVWQEARSLVRLS